MGQYFNQKIECASRAEITDYVLSPDDPAAPLNRGWRREALGGALRALV